MPRLPERSRVPFVRDTHTRRLLGSMCLLEAIAEQRAPVYVVGPLEEDWQWEPEEQISLGVRDGDLGLMRPAEARVAELSIMAKRILGRLSEIIRDERERLSDERA